MLSEHSQEIEELEFTEEELEQLRQSKTVDDYIEEVIDNASGYKT